MVQLRVDVEAANARRAFNQAADAVDNLGDQLTDARIDAVRLEGALDDAADEVRRLEQEIRDADAAGRDSTALRQQLDAARRAANDARDAFANANHEVDRLERELSRARHEAQRLQHTMNRLDADANRGFRRAQRGLLGFIHQARDAGQRAAGAFSGGFAGLPTELKAAAMAAGAVVGATFGLAAIAAVNGILLAGLGAGIIGLGATIAAKQSDVVQAAWMKALEPVKDEVSKAAVMFEGPLLRASDKFAEAWVRSGGAVRRMFNEVVDDIDPLVDGIIGLVENALPGLEKAVAAAGPVLRELADILPGVGDAVSDMFESFADGGDGAVKGIRAIGAVIVGTLRLIGDTVEIGSKLFDKWTEKIEDIATAASKVPLIGRAFDDAADFWQRFNDDSQGAIRSMEEYVPAAGAATDGTLRLSEAEKKAAKEAQNLSDKLTGLVSAALGSVDAALAWEEAIDNLTESVKENGHAIDITTDAGQANIQAVREMVAAAEQGRRAAIELAGGENASAAAVEAANAKFRQQIKDLEAMLLKMGFTKAQVDALLSSYRDLANAPNITKTIDFYYRTRGTAAKEYQVPGASIGSGNLRFAAGGGSFKRGEWGVVGEKGPELVHWGDGARVYSNTDSARMLAKGSGGGAYTGGRMNYGSGGSLQLVAGGGPRSSSDWLTGAVTEAIKRGRIKLRVRQNGTVTAG